MIFENRVYSWNELSFENRSMYIPRNSSSQLIRVKTLHKVFGRGGED